MRKLNLNSIITACLLCVGLYACNQANQENKNAVAENVKPSATMPEDGYQPDADFDMAREAFAKRDFANSSKYIDKAVQYMRDLSIGVSDEEKQQIQRSMLELEDLSRDVRADRVDGLDELDYYFGRAFLAVADSKVIASEKLVVEGQKENADSTMQEAMHHFENASKRLEKDWKKDEDSVFSSMQHLSMKMKKDSKTEKSEIEQDFKKLKSDMKSMDRNLKKDAITAS